MGCAITEDDELFFCAGTRIGGSVLTLTDWWIKGTTGLYCSSDDVGLMDVRMVGMIYDNYEQDARGII